MDCAYLRNLLKEAGVKGRSKAVTHAALLDLCHLHHLLPCTKQSTELPDDILRVIIENVVSGLISKCTKKAAGELCMTLMRFSLVCTEWQSMFGPTGKCWQELLDRLLVDVPASDPFHESLCSAQQAVVSGTCNARKALCLVSIVGCELCGAQRIRKVHWPFVVRCCQSCLESHTISDYRLKNDYSMPENVLQGLPHTIGEMYTPRFGAYTLRFYWRLQALEELRKVHAPGRQGLSFDDIDAILAERRERAAEKERQELLKRRDAMFDAVVSGTDNCTGPFRSAEALSAASPTFRRLKSVEAAEKKASTVIAEAIATAQRQKVTTWVRELLASADLTEKQRAAVERYGDLRTLRERAGSTPCSTKASFKVDVWPSLLVDFVAKAQHAADPYEARESRPNSSNRNEMRTCPLCFRSKRLFTEQGLFDHTMAVHKL